MHRTVVEVHVKLDDLLNEIDASDSQNLDGIKKSIREIAIKYKDLENETRALIKRTAQQAERVHRMATRALEKILAPQDAISCMENNFQSLIDQVDGVKLRHAEMCESLREEARRAKEAKAQNDEGAKRAEELREDAESWAIMAIPDFNLIRAPVTLAKEFAGDNSDDETAVKVLKGTGGALMGLGFGIGLTAISPFFLAYSAVCGARLAVLSRSWSKTFKDIEGQIVDVHDIIDNSSECLNNVKSSLLNLNTDIAQWNPSIQAGTVNIIFTDIADSSNELRKTCEQYEESLKSNKKRLKEITGTNQ